MKYIALHHTAVGRGRPQYDAVNRYHKEKFGMQSRGGSWVCYNEFCEASGTQIHVRDYDEETCANVGHNCDVPARCDTISYCMAGDFNKETPTDKQIESFKKFVNLMRRRYPGIRVVFHRDLQKNRTCPGKKITKDYLTNVMLAEPESPDTVDKEKQERIKELQLMVDRLSALLRQLYELVKRV